MKAIILKKIFVLVFLAQLTIDYICFGQCNPNISSVYYFDTPDPTLRVNELSAQASAIINLPINSGQPRSVCINMSASGSQEYIVSVNNASCPILPNSPVSPSYQVTGLGQIVITSAVSTTGTTSTFRFRSVDNSLCKGRIIFSVRYPATTINTCTTQCSPPVVSAPISVAGGTFFDSLDVFKNVTSYEPLLGPRCLTPGLVTYSINPRLQCPLDGIGLNNITWAIGSFAGTQGDITPITVVSPAAPPLYNTNPPHPTTGIRVAFLSADRTNISFFVPNNVTLPSLPSVGVRLGNCPGTGFSPQSITPIAGAGEIDLTGTSTIPQIGQLHLAMANSNCFGPTSGCTSTINGTLVAAPGFSALANVENGIVLPVNASNTISTLTLSVNGNGGGADLNHIWTIPSGGFVSAPQPAPNSNVNNISVPVNATGRFRVELTKGCKQETANYNLYRVLTPPTSAANAPSTFLAGIFNNYITSSNPIPLSCYNIGNTETLTLQNAPKGENAIMVWTVPSGWNIIMASSGNPADASVINNANGVLTGRRVNVVTISPTGNAQPGKVSVRMQLPTYSNQPTFNWVGLTAGSSPTVSYPFATNFTPANRTVTVENVTAGQPAQTVTYTFAAGSPTGSTTRRTNISITKNNAAALDFFNACSGTGFEFQYQFKGKVYATSAERDANGVSIADYDNAWTCNNTFVFSTAAPCPAVSPGNPDVSAWLNPTGDDFNINFRTGRFYKGAYRFRIRTNAVNACPEFSCFAGDWVYFPNTATDGNTPNPGNWRVATEASWDGGEEIKSMEVFPNPSKGSFTIRLPEGEAGKYELINVAGKTILTGEASDSEKMVDTKSLAKGVYTLKYRGKNNFTKKVVLQ